MVDVAFPFSEFGPTVLRALKFLAMDATDVLLGVFLALELFTALLAFKILKSTQELAFVSK